VIKQRVYNILENDVEKFARLDKAFVLDDVRMLNTVSVSISDLRMTGTHVQILEQVNLGLRK